jgi:hypothetical protein
MKAIVYPFFLLFLTYVNGFGQCSKHVLLTSSRTEYLDNSLIIQRIVDESSLIEITNTEITITPGSAENKMSGVINVYKCIWTLPFKEGKTTIEAMLHDAKGECTNATITIEGKKGKVTFLLEAEKMQGRKIRLLADKFEEKD